MSVFGRGGFRTTHGNVGTNPSLPVRRTADEFASGSPIWTTISLDAGLGKEISPVSKVSDGGSCSTGVKRGVGVIVAEGVGVGAGDPTVGVGVSVGGIRGVPSAR